MGKNERETVQDKCVEYLGNHPAVAWVHTTTSGTVRRKGFFIKVGYPGMGDIVGMLKTGQFLSVECKTKGNLPTNDQWAFMNMINHYGGVATWCESVEMLELFFDENIQG